MIDLIKKNLMVFRWDEEVVVLCSMFGFSVFYEFNLTITANLLSTNTSDTRYLTMLDFMRFKELKIKKTNNCPSSPHLF